MIAETEDDIKQSSVLDLIRSELQEIANKFPPVMYSKFQLNDEDAISALYMTTRLALPLEDRTMRVYDMLQIVIPILQKKICMLDEKITKLSLKEIS